MSKPTTIRKPPVVIPLPFEKAVEGLLGVDPKLIRKKKKPAKKAGKARKKR